MNHSALPSRACLAAALVLALGLTGHVSAQTAEARNIAPEAAPAFPAFQQWLHVALPPLPTVATTPAVSSIKPLPLQPQAVVTGAMTYQPVPVILGLPELPLVRGAPAPDGQWSSQFNYQGMHVRFVVLDSDGRALGIRGVNNPPRPGERFKVRVTPTFEAVAEVDLVIGDTWSRQRVGQVYPQPGFSVLIKAGETADLPLGASEFFVFPQDQPGLATVLSVRHPKALGDNRSDQPAYRQDGRQGSDYLQLIPQRRFAAMEQLITVGR